MFFHANSKTPSCFSNVDRPFGNFCTESCRHILLFPLCSAYPSGGPTDYWWWYEVFERKRLHICCTLLPQLPTHPRHTGWSLMCCGLVPSCAVSFYSAFWPPILIWLFWCSTLDNHTGRGLSVCVLPLLRDPVPRIPPWSICQGVFLLHSVCVVTDGVKQNSGTGLYVSSFCKQATLHV